jgi:hypothetical protein
MIFLAARLVHAHQEQHIEEARTYAPQPMGGDALTLADFLVKQAIDSPSQRAR